MSFINVYLIDEFYNIIEALNLLKPKTYSSLLDTINSESKNLFKEYEIFFEDNNKENIISNDEDYAKVKDKDVLYIRDVGEFQKSFHKLSDSMNINFEDKYSCIICKEIIQNENPLFCYRCQKLYHKNCLNKWKTTQESLHKVLTCTTCKYKLDFKKWESIKDYEYKKEKEEKTTKIIEECYKNRTQLRKIFKNLLNEIMEIKSLLQIKNKKITINQLSNNLLKDLPNIIDEELKLIKNYLKNALGSHEYIEKEENLLDTDKNEINIIYKKDKKQKKNQIRIFGKEFVKNNKDKCYMIINNRKYDLREKFTIKDDELNVKIIGINRVISMKCMFSECDNLYSLPDISKWDTKNINDMSFIFYKCSNLQEISDISKWDTSNVINMSGMFSGCKKLKVFPNISKWDIRRVKYLGGIYKNISSLVPLTDLELSTITKDGSKYINDAGMFSNCSSLEILPPNISGWNTINVSNMECLFSNCSSLKILPDLSKWNTENITSFKNLFYSCSSLEILSDISQWNTDKVINMENMFSFCSSLKNLPNLSYWNTENVTSMENIFSACSSLISLPDISKWNTKNVTNMEGMFSFCSSIISLPNISKWNTENTINMRMMFNYCSKLFNLPDISKWNTTNVASMEGMFSFCSSLTSLPDISKWNTCNTIDMSMMFNYCSKLSSLPDISKWNTSKVLTMQSMFSFCYTLKKLPDISIWNIKKDTNIQNMFHCCNKRLNIPQQFIA